METLAYVGKARKQAHGANGLLYVNRWATGAQNLIFNNKEDAQKFAESRKIKVKHGDGTGDRF